MILAFCGQLLILCLLVRSSSASAYDIDSLVLKLNGGNRLSRQELKSLMTFEFSDAGKHQGALSALKSSKHFTSAHLPRILKLLVSLGPGKSEKTIWREVKIHAMSQAEVFSKEAGPEGCEFVERTFHKLSSLSFRRMKESDMWTFFKNLRSNVYMKSCTGGTLPLDLVLDLVKKDRKSLEHVDKLFFRNAYLDRITHQVHFDITKLLQLLLSNAIEYAADFVSVMIRWTLHDQQDLSQTDLPALFAVLATSGTDKSAEMDARIQALSKVKKTLVEKLSNGYWSSASDYKLIFSAVFVTPRLCLHSNTQIDGCDFKSTLAVFVQIIEDKNKVFEEPPLCRMRTGAFQASFLAAHSKNFKPVGLEKEVRELEAKLSAEVFSCLSSLKLLNIEGILKDMHEVQHKDFEKFFEASVESLQTRHPLLLLKFALNHIRDDAPSGSVKFYKALERILTEGLQTRLENAKLRLAEKIVLESKDTAIRDRLKLVIESRLASL